MIDSKYEPSADCVMSCACTFGISVSAKALVETLTAAGYEDRPTQRRIQSLLDRGDLHLAKDLLMQPVYVRTGAVV